MAGHVLKVFFAIPVVEPAASVQKYFQELMPAVRSGIREGGNTWI